MATRTFDGTTDTSWTDATNWAGDTKPGNGDDVVIDAACVLDEDTTADTFASLTINANDSLDLNDYNIKVSGNVVISASATLTGGSGTLNVTGDGNLDWDASGATFTPETSTVKLEGDNTIDTVSGSDQFYNLDCAYSGKTTLVDDTDITVTNVLTVNGGTIDSDSVWRDVILTGTSNPLVENGTTTWSLVLKLFPSGNGSIDLPGGTYEAIQFQSGDNTVSLTLTGDIMVTRYSPSGYGGLQLIDNNWTFDTDGYNMTFTDGDRKGLVLGDPFGIGCTAHFRDSVITLNTPSKDAQCMTVGGYTSTTYNFNSSTWTVPKGLKQISGGGGSTWDLGSSTWSVGGDILLDTDAGHTASITGGTSTITLNGTGAQEVDFVEETVNDLEVTNTGGIVTFSDGFTAAELKLNPGTSLKFSNADTFTITDIDWQGAAGNLITLRSDSDGSQWNLNVSGTQTVSYVDVKDSDASGGDEIVAENSTDSGNNDNWSFITAGWQVTYYYYDDLDRQIAVKNAEEDLTYYGYDDAGNRIRVKDADEHATYFHYDDVDRLESQVDALDNATYYGYDAVGNRLSVTDPKDQSTYYGYDRANRLVSVRDPEGGETAYSYDRAGRRVDETVER